MGALAETSLETTNQHRVLRQLSERIVRLLKTEIRASIGRDVPVHLAYQGEAGMKSPHLTLMNYWIDPVTDRTADRYEERGAKGQEFFRNAPLLLKARYLLTAWAHPPDDQELLMLAARVFLDNPALEADGNGDEDAVHWEDGVSIEHVVKFNMEEAKTVVDGLGIPLRPSVRYDVHFRLDSERKQPIKRVKERIVDYKKLDG